jgi:hypothetical protein
MTRRKHQHPTITLTFTFTLTAATAHVIVVDILGHFPIAGEREYLLSRYFYNRYTHVFI